MRNDGRIPVVVGVTGHRDLREQDTEVLMALWDGTDESKEEYSRRGYACGWNSRYVDVAKLINEYRCKVNPKVNVFCIQTAGYTNVLVPEYGYRTNILYGWTGKEAQFADAMIKFWDEKDAQAENK